MSYQNVVLALIPQRKNHAGSIVNKNSPPKIRGMDSTSINEPLIARRIGRALNIPNMAKIAPTIILPG